MANIPNKKYAFVALLALLCLCSVGRIYAQFEPQSSQYMYRKATFNPASIAENGLFNVGGTHRIEWVGMPGAPQTTYFTINMPLISKERVVHGVGVKFLNDKIGAFSNQAAQIQYAYKRKVGKGRLSLGVELGFVSTSFILDSIKNANVNSEYHDFAADEAIPQKDETGNSFDMSVGAFYSAKKYYLGISYVHLSNPTIKLNLDKTHLKVLGTLYTVGGYRFPLPIKKLELATSALFKSDFVSWQADLSAVAEYDRRFWGGISYRFQDAVTILAGANVMDGLSIGYSYDLPTGKMLTVSSGSHEIFVRYSFLLDFGKNKNIYKSIRLL